MLLMLHTVNAANMLHTIEISGALHRVDSKNWLPTWFRQKIGLNWTSINMLRHQIQPMKSADDTPMLHQIKIKLATGD